eukprot:3726371-Alexandrium_andersonii.AAC.1
MPAKRSNTSCSNMPSTSPHRSRNQATTFPGGLGQSRLSSSALGSPPHSPRPRRETKGAQGWPKCVRSWGEPQPTAS